MNQEECMAIKIRVVAVAAVIVLTVGLGLSSRQVANAQPAGEREYKVVAVADIYDPTVSTRLNEAAKGGWRLVAFRSYLNEAENRGLRVAGQDFAHKHTLHYTISIRKLLSNRRAGVRPK
jgi:hypothetical protein